MPGPLFQNVLAYIYTCRSSETRQTTHECNINQTSKSREGWVVLFLLCKRNNVSGCEFNRRIFFSQYQPRILLYEKVARTIVPSTRFFYFDYCCYTSYFLSLSRKYITACFPRADLLFSDHLSAGWDWSHHDSEVNWIKFNFSMYFYFRDENDKNILDRLIRVFLFVKLVFVFLHLQFLYMQHIYAHCKWRWLLLIGFNTFVICKYAGIKSLSSLGGLILQVLFVFCFCFF